MTKLRFRGSRGEEKPTEEVMAHLRASAARQQEILANRDKREPAEVVQQNAAWAWHEIAATDSKPAEWELRSEPMKWFDDSQPGAPLQSTYALNAALKKLNATFTLERGPNGDDLKGNEDVRFVVHNHQPHIFTTKERMTANHIAKIVGLDEQHELTRVTPREQEGIASHLRRGPTTCHTGHVVESGQGDEIAR